MVELNLPKTAQKDVGNAKLLAAAPLSKAGFISPSLLSLPPALNNLCALFILSIAPCANCDRKIYSAFNYVSEAPGKTMERGSVRRGGEILSE